MDPNEVLNNDNYVIKEFNYIPSSDFIYVKLLELVYFIFLIITLILIIIEVLKSKNKKETLKKIIMDQGPIITISLLLIAFRNSRVFAELYLEGILYFLPLILAVIISIVLFIIEIKKLKENNNKSV